MFLTARMTIFEQDEDYEAFERVLHEVVARTATRLVAYCVLPNHWHLVVWPQVDGELSRFTGWLTLTHTQRWHSHRQSTGSGHVYPGRFKSFPVQDDDHFYTACRYVERNAFRANPFVLFMDPGIIHVGRNEVAQVRAGTAQPLRRPKCWRLLVPAYTLHAGKSGNVGGEDKIRFACLCSGR